jgi:DNA-binding HxlR family transcriptional regulator
MAKGEARFGDFLKSPERIPTNVLTDRLARLEEHGLIAKRAYQTNPTRYEYALTPKGAELVAVLQAICVWANKHMPETWRTPDHFLALKATDLAGAEPGE